MTSHTFDGKDTRMLVGVPRSRFLVPLIMCIGCRGTEATTAAPLPSATAAKPEVAASRDNPHALLDAMDTRTPVPLVPMMASHQKQNMRDHLAAVQEIVAAVAANDFPGVEKAAGRIGFSEQMGMMCQHMGAGAPGFTEAALNFHHTADSITEAAKRKDAQAVLTALSTTLATCTSCHSTFKQEVVDDATWASITKQKAPSGQSHR